MRPNFEWQMDKTKPQKRIDWVRQCYEEKEKKVTALTATNLRLGHQVTFWRSQGKLE